MISWLSNDFRRVPLAIYTDPSIYSQELQCIFKGRSWNYVGLSSEVAKPGDFIQTYVGEVSVVLVRDLQNKLRVFVNRCTHRGAQICYKQRGNTKVLTCPYHKWSFNLEGKLVGIPFRRGISGKGGMSPSFEPLQHGLEQLNVAEHNGVVFASYAKDIEPLEQYIGPNILSYFDRVCDGRSLKVIGKIRHYVKSNWKLQVENLKDPFHAALLHEFFVAFGIWRSDQETEVRVDELGRNSVLVSTASFKKSTHNNPKETASERKGLYLEDYSIIAHQREYEYGTGSILTIWPNLILLQQLNCLAMRHIRPNGPDSCVKTWTFFGYESDTPELLQKRLKQINLLGPSGLVTIDDNEILAITQAGVSGSPNSQAVLEVGQGSGDTNHMLTESAIRGFYKYYKSIMDDENI